MNVSGTATTGNEHTPLFAPVLLVPPVIMESMPVDSAAGSGAAEEAREPLLHDGHGRRRFERSTGTWTAAAAASGARIHHRSHSAVVKLPQCSKTSVDDGCSLRNNAVCAHLAEYALSRC